MKIGVKLILGFMSTVAIIAVSGIFAYSSMGKIHKSALDMSQHATEIRVVGKLQTLLAQVVMPANDYIIIGNTKYKGEFQKISGELQEQIKILKGLELTQEERKLLDDIRLDFDKVKEKANQILDIDIQIQTINPVAARLMEEMDYQYAFPMVEKAERLHAASQKHMEKEMRSADKLYQQLKAAVIAFVGLGALIAVLLGLLISRGIARPIGRLSQAA